MIRIIESINESDVKYVLTARSMWNDDYNNRNSFIDEVYNSLEEAEPACREFQRDLASHMRAGIEEVNSDLVATGPYWELFRGQLEKKM